MFVFIAMQNIVMDVTGNVCIVNMTFAELATDHVPNVIAINVNRASLFVNSLDVTNVWQNQQHLPRLLLTIV
jgi:hypothetical protein